MSISDIFSTQTGPNRNVDQIHSREDALQRALALEKTTLSYYRALQDALGPHDILTAIINAEKEHVVRVMRYMITGARLRNLTDSF